MHFARKKLVLFMTKFNLKTIELFSGHRWSCLKSIQTEET